MPKHTRCHPYPPTIPSVQKTEPLITLPVTSRRAAWKTAEGYRIELFASEREFPELANPSQIAFDNQGRLWVSTMPSYPHYRMGDPKPDDKLLILEDSDNDGRADNVKVFADGLHIPIGF